MQEVKVVKSNRSPDIQINTELKSFLDEENTSKDSRHTTVQRQHQETEP